MEKHPPAGDRGGKAVIDIDDDRWRQIERAYGAPMPQAARAAIIRATEALLTLYSFEGAPALLAKVKITLESHDKAASRFFNDLFTCPSVMSDAGTYAHYLIENNFKSSQSSVTKLGLDGLLDALRAFHIACNASIKQLDDQSSSDNRKGEAWKIWINRLDEVMPQREGSNFASLVREMQSCLPPHCRHNEATLDKEVREALQKK